MIGRTSRGQALVEFALVLLPLVILFFGLLDFGRAIYAYNTLSNAARQGARQAIVDQTPGVAAKAAADSAISLGLSKTDGSQIVVTYSAPAGSPARCSGTPGFDVGCFATVTTNYRYTAATPLIGSIVGPIQLSSTTQLLVERTYP